MVALLVNCWGYSESGDQLKRQIIIPDGDREIVLSTDWSGKAFRHVHRREAREAHKSVRAVEMPQELVQTVRDFLQLRSALDDCMEHLSRLAS